MADFDELLESFSAISELLKTPNLQNQLKQDTDLGTKISELETLVEEIKIQHDETAMSKVTRSSALEEINAKLNELLKHCEKNSIKFEFLKNLKPLN